MSAGLSTTGSVLLSDISVATSADTAAAAAAAACISTAVFGSSRMAATALIGGKSSATSDPLST